MPARCTCGVTTTSASRRCPAAWPTPVWSCRTIARPSGWRDTAALLTRTLARDPRLAPRFAGARMTDAPVVLGPMAVDAPRPGAPGLLLAGDAAGFIDPMTGDGLNLAFGGARLAASIAARRARASGWRGGGAVPARRRTPRRVRGEVAVQSCAATAGGVATRGGRGRGGGASLARCVSGDDPIRGRRMTPAVAIAGLTLVAVLLIMAGEAALSAHNESVLRVARRGRAARRCVSHDAVGVSGVLRGDGDRGCAHRSRAARRPAPRTGGPGLREGAEDFGDHRARRALDLPRARAAGCAARHGRTLSLAAASELRRRARRVGRHGADVWAPVTGALSILGFGSLLWKRVRVEERALGRHSRETIVAPHD